MPQLNSSRRPDDWSKTENPLMSASNCCQGPMSYTLYLLKMRIGSRQHLQMNGRRSLSALSIKTTRAVMNLHENAKRHASDFPAFHEAAQYVILQRGVWACLLRSKTCVRFMWCCNEWECFQWPRASKIQQEQGARLRWIWDATLK